MTNANEQGYLTTFKKHLAENTKFTDDEVNRELTDAATSWMRDYKGTFSYVLDVQDRSSQTLSAGQIRGLLNCMLADMRYQARHSSNETEASKPTTVTQPVADGYYTVVLSQGEHRTFRLRHGRISEGKDHLQWIGFLCGPGNETNYQLCAVVDDAQQHQLRWVKGYGAEDKDKPLVTALECLFRATPDQHKGYGKAYAMKSGNCYVCGKLLTDPLSIELGIGPICRQGT